MKPISVSIRFGLFTAAAVIALSACGKATQSALREEESPASLTAEADADEWVSFGADEAGMKTLQGDINAVRAFLLQALRPGKVVFLVAPEVDRTAL